MKKIRLRYLDSIVNAKYSSLEKQSNKGSLILSDDELQFVRKDKTVPIKQIKSVEAQKTSGFRVEQWVQVNYLTDQGNDETTYFTRRSFYHPSTKKIEKKLREFMEKDLVV